jgi:acetyl esterase/lipase
MIVSVSAHSAVLSFILLMPGMTHPNPDPYGHCHRRLSEGGQMNRRHQPAEGPDRRDVLVRSVRPPDLTLRYGDEVSLVADVHLPSPDDTRRAGIDGRALFALFLHGGFWRAQYGREHTAPLAEALARAGFAVCAPEYRRSGQRGGGWPGTFDDVAAAVDRLPGLVRAATGGLVDAERMVLAGHSAGGHLALWAASRHRLPAESPWRRPDAATNCGVVALAAVSDLVACHDLRLGKGAVDALMGGGPRQFPDRYAAADPTGLVPIGAPVRLVHGTADDQVPHEFSVEYAVRARAAGDLGTECTLLPGAGHFDVIDPLSDAWGSVELAFRSAWPAG